VSFYYLATPYSKYPAGIVQAHADACAQAALLVKAGIPVYSPIAHTHPIAIEGRLDPYDHELWLEADRTFMEAAKGLIVCEMEGWQASYGIECEIKYFAQAGKPRFQMVPGVVPDLSRKQRLIGLCGYAGSGKDEAAKGLVADGWERVALADAVREALLALDPVTPTLWTTDPPSDNWSYHHPISRDVKEYGWGDVKKSPYARQLLQRMGTEAGRDIHGQDCWVNIARRKILATTSDVVVTDIRFANEAAMIRELGGALIRVERPGVGPVNEHVSEVMPFEADHTLLNDGSIEQLHDTIRQLACIDEPTDLAELEAA
jgi:hypothetical protein